MNHEQFLKECRNKAFNSGQLEIIKEAVDYGIEPEKIRILAKIQYDEYQMEQLLRSLKENISPEILELLTDEKQNHFVMAEILDGAIEGLTLEEIKTYALLNISPQEMKKKRQKLIEQKKGEESENLTVLMEVLKSEMEVIKNGFYMMENQSEKLQEMILSQKEEELKEVRQLVEAKELVIKNLQAVNRERQEKITQLTKLIEEKEKDIQNPLTKKKESITDFMKEREDIEHDKCTLLQSTKEEIIFNKNNIPANHNITKKKTNFLFQKKKPDLMRIVLEKNLSAEQTKEIRLGIEDGLSEEQLIMMADASLSPELLIEIRSTMKQLNERRKGEENHV